MVNLEYNKIAGKILNILIGMPEPIQKQFMFNEKLDNTSTGLFIMFLDQIAGIREQFGYDDGDFEAHHFCYQLSYNHLIIWSQGQGEEEGDDDFDVFNSEYCCEKWSERDGILFDGIQHFVIGFHDEYYKRYTFLLPDEAV